MGSCLRTSSRPRVIINDNEGQEISEANTKTSRKFKQSMPDPRLSKDTKVPTDAKFAIVQDKSKSKADISFINVSLTKHFIFNSLTEEQRESVINHMKYYILEPREIVFEQNSVGSTFFVIAHGKLEVIIDEKRVNVLRPQDSFGELALIHDTPRSATLKTIENSSLWGVDRKTFRNTLEQINALNYAENHGLIESIPVFKILNNTQIESLISSIATNMYGQGQVIVNEGETGDLLFIIKQGSVVCSQEGKDIKTMEKGDYFGEQALLYNSVRTATITAAENTKCLTIGRTELTKLFGTSLQLIIHKNSQRIAFDKNVYLKKLTKTQFEKLLNCSEIKELSEGEKVIFAGTRKGDNVVVVIKGELTTLDEEIVYKVFDIIGLDEAIQALDDVFENDYYAKGDVNLAIIPNISFFNAIGGDYHKVTTNNDAIKLLKKIPLFRYLSEEQFESLIQCLRVENFKNETIIFSQNQPGESLFLIKSGRVEVIDKDTNRVLRNITKDDYFGERSLLFDKFRSATIKAKGEVTCWVLYKSDFMSILDEKLKKLLMKRIELQDDNLNLNDFHIVNQIGTGTFGNVFLVIHKQKKSLYALKAVNKKKIRAYEMEDNLLLERKILLQIDHVLISKLIKTFKDDKRVYFLLEYIRGMNLFNVLRKLDVLTVADAKFYTACIFLMLEHLHERDIIYRDLHPMNIMIDDEGYPKLIDFGAAKIIKGRTYTIAGIPPHYMAPEIITGHGYTLSADYWSAGIMLYEFLYAAVPFGEEENDPYVVYEMIQQGKLVFPTNADNKDKIKDLLVQLLSKNPATRLGGSFENLKAHHWFIGINWEKIVRRELPTPYVPILSTILHDAETALKQRKPLDEVITKAEKHDEIPKPRPIKEGFNVNWDEEFKG
ncbi:hypothetical protein SteCoe_7976 [Stentor coeruleus]|uniref:cGMP-dependent protein kinase n=1 Tax=Stentor coeruleus TaxID=5963 RepID=A0A1R2CLD7_9CILI|nr:hypothetical protein SteCoe_7976 [Stentor coeruleus]